MLDLRPSGASTWTRCYASALMSARMPSEAESDPAREGTCAAWLAELALTKKIVKCSDAVGMIHSNGWVVTVGMARYIQPYVDMITRRGGEIHTERKVRLNSMIAGTPDAFAVITSDGTLHVDDLKYGFGLVNPYRNPQISIYAGAIIRMLTARGVIIRNVSIGVFQPRAWHPLGEYRTWNVLPENLMEFVHWIEAQGVEAQREVPVATPGEQCRYCPAASTCKAVGHALYQWHDHTAAAEQRHMSEVELANELTFLDKIEDMMKGRRAAVEAEAEARVKNGQHLPGFHMEERRGHAKFTVSRETVKVLTGIDPVNEKLMTPGEAVEAGADPAVIGRLSARPTLKPKLKPVPEGFYTTMFPKL